MMRKVFLFAAAAIMLIAAQCTPQDSLKVPIISNLTVVNIGSTTVELIFDLDIDAKVYYDVRASTLPAPNAAEIKAIGGGDFSAGTGLPSGTFILLTPNTQHTAYYVAENSNGFSKVVSVTFTTLPVPPVISEVTAPDAELTSTSVGIKFTLNAQAQFYYMLYFSSEAAPNAATIKAQGPAVWKMPANLSASSYHRGITGLASSTSYTLYMVAENTGGFSNVASITFTTLP